jgi:two-component sensor histidine kinase
VAEQTLSLEDRLEALEFAVEILAQLADRESLRFRMVVQALKSQHHQLSTTIPLRPMGGPAAEVWSQTLRILGIPPDAEAGS